MISKMTTSKVSVHILTVLCLVQQTMVCYAASDFIREINYMVPGKSLRLMMGSTNELTANVQLNKDAIIQMNADRIAIKFMTKTISPQFHILSLDTTSVRVVIDKRSLESAKYLMNVKLKLWANFIGHALVEPVAIEFTGINAKANIFSISDKKYQLPVTIVQDEGIWGKIFIVSVVILMIVSYINLGAQLDEENMRQVIKKPLKLILGFLTSVLIMPLVSWFIGRWLFHSQTLFRVGSFVFACSPAASASTLWTVMLNSDKELSVGLQVLSTVGALVTMPFLLYVMEQSMKFETTNHHITVVPYGRLVQALFVLLVALLVGWRFVGRNERAQKLSRRIFRPLVFFVLIFIVVFSSVLYWHIYHMFDRTIMFVALIITLATYILSSLLGYVISFDVNKAVAIAIGSAYKNSGITFAVLLVAFEAPDTYIAYVPCLAQIIVTSVSLYIVYITLSLVGCVRRRGQPDPIQATEEGLDKEAPKRRRNSGHDASDRAGSDAKDEDNDEFIAMNVTDIEADAALDYKPRMSSDAMDHQTEVKLIAGANQVSDV